MVICKLDVIHPGLVFVGVETFDHFVFFVTYFWLRIC